MSQSMLWIEINFLIIGLYCLIIVFAAKKRETPIVVSTGKLGIETNSPIKGY